MKKEFIGFYDPTKDEIDTAWKDGVFAFDANTLLNLYRYTEVTRKDFLEALKSINDKLFIPYQVAYEYLNNRVGVISGLEEAYDDLKLGFEENFEKNLKKHIYGFKKHPAIIVENIIKLHQEFVNKVEAELEKQKKKHPSFKENDYILDNLTVLFENCVGKEPLKEELRKIYEEGKNRYSDLIPPGFKDLEDKRKKGDRNVYGDLIIWKELIDYCKKNQKPLIFVTDDRKEDWWKIENGKTIRPREELIKEFYDLTGIRILIYNADQFLRFAKERSLVAGIKEETIEEIKSVRMSDERRNSYISTLLANDLYKSVNNNSIYQAVSGLGFPSQSYERYSQIFGLPGLGNEIYWPPKNYTSLADADKKNENEDMFLTMVDSQAETIKPNTASEELKNVVKNTKDNTKEKPETK